MVVGNEPISAPTFQYGLIFLHKNIMQHYVLGLSLEANNIGITVNGNPCSLLLFGLVLICRF